MVFEDTDGNGRLSYNEGRGDATISLRNAEPATTQSVQSWDAGMYQVPLDPGTYDVTLEVDGKVLRPETLDMGSANAKIDFNLRSLPSRGPAATMLAQARVATPPVAKNEAQVLEQRDEASQEQKGQVPTRSAEERGEQIIDAIAEGLLSEMKGVSLKISSTWRAR